MSKVSENDKNVGLFIPAGVILGMGIGFLVNNFMAGLMIGLGAGFFLFAIFSVFKIGQK